jgi:hypothetical protein
MRNDIEELDEVRRFCLGAAVVFVADEFGGYMVLTERGLWAAGLRNKDTIWRDGRVRMR